MKKLTFTILLFVCAIGENARTKTYTNNNANLSFTYSDEFNSVQIQNAPHMLLELEKGDIILALSCWHYGLGYSYTAWNNDFVTMTKEKYTNNPYLSLVAIDKKYFVSNVDDELFDCTIDPNFIEWSQLTPVNHEECLDCPALGICGGGCPINAMNAKKGNSIHSIDTRFCAHAKKTLNFLIHDLYRIMLERTTKNE